MSVTRVALFGGPPAWTTGDLADGINSGLHKAGDGTNVLAKRRAGGASA